MDGKQRLTSLLTFVAGTNEIGNIKWDRWGAGITAHFSDFVSSSHTTGTDSLTASSH